MSECDNGNMTGNATKMEVDTPGFLKRSNSAPMIHNINAAMSTSQFSSRNANIPSCSNSNGNNFFVADSRPRRFSASYSPRYNCLNSRAVARVDQIRQEECTDILDREVAHENKVHSTMRISQSWEDLSLMLEAVNKNCDENGKTKKSGMLSNSARSSPSPTRCGNFARQCYSPSVFRTNLSPSPTRKAFATRRSLSPIAVRPSTLGPVKRKFDLVDNEPPAKRYSGGLLIAQPRLEVSTSPLPSSVSSVGTPESFSSADSPGGFSFNAPDSPCDHPMRDLTKADTNVV